MRMEGRCVLEVGRSVVALTHRDAPAGVLRPTNKSCLGPWVRIIEWLSAASDKSVSVSVPTSTPSGCVAPLGGSSISRPQRAASLCADRVQALPCEVGRRCSPGPDYAKRAWPCLSPAAVCHRGIRPAFIVTAYSIHSSCGTRHHRRSRRLGSLTSTMSR